ncbi:hypothetical protein BDB00DRAFT_817115 [Zychaea mexicana]|uniref:uncharacterized protein n=1 Tax=Zychaea mexicana TaxID=64656 RepID=UPI0022FEB3CB|nr:uncharacterized protein BDB00DRAFT_817115 [Zychaea mexicana]KAI9494797.1 hypothetical protein BDB00DRAFT_817115 [Zychaea mexicana]
MSNNNNNNAPTNNTTGSTTGSITTTSDAGAGIGGVNTSPLSNTEEHVAHGNSFAIVDSAQRIKSELTWYQLVHAEIIAVTSAMRKNARWSGMNVNGLNMGGLGMSMGLRKGQANAKEPHTRNQENPLMKGFTNLREYLGTLEDVSELDALVLLNPFLEVIRSGNTTGPIAGTALGSIEKFLHYGIVGLQNPSVAFAMNALSSAATHCKFEASDAASDELVLLRMLQVLQMALTSECGQVLSDEAVCEMMETGLSMCCQMRLSEMLRRSAEHVMINMVISIFERLKTLEEEWVYIESPKETTTHTTVAAAATVEKEGQKNSHSPAAPHMSTPRTSPSPTPSGAKQQQTEPSESQDGEAADGVTTEFGVVERDSTGDTNDAAAAKSTGSTDQQSQSDDQVVEKGAENTESTGPAPLKPYGLPAIRELLRVLISLLNPHEHKHTDSMRLMALSILNVAFEVGGKSISRFETLRILVADEFCKYLFQLAKTDTTPLLTLTLRVISTVIDTMRPHLKLQQELFLFFLIERLSPSSGAGSRGMVIDVDEEGTISLVPSSTSKDTAASGEKAAAAKSHVDVRSGSPSVYARSGKNNGSEYAMVSPEVRELLLECLLQCARIPTFMVDLWFNYDCDLSCGDLFEEIIQFLSKNSFPDPQGFSGFDSHTLCLDTLLMFIDQLVERIDHGTELSNDLTSSDVLLELKSRKRLVLKGASLFNESPKKGIKFLIDNGVIEADKDGDTTESLAEFLRSTQQLNKKSLGEYLGKPDKLPLLQVFMRQFEFAGKRMDEALRVVLETFRLPGESQQIMRVTDTFAEVFFESNPTEIANPEAAQLLAYSIILLNTDQHNPQIRRRMTLEDYMRNLRGVNDGKDFPKEHLQEIYECIKHDEIVMPEEHEGQLGFNYAWKQLLQRSKSSGPFVVCDTAAYDKNIFQLAWKPALAAIAYAFDTAQDDATLQKAISGFHQCAMLASHFKLYEVFDAIVVNLANMTGLLEESNSRNMVPDPIVDVAGQKYVVSHLAVRFGRNYKGQLAAVVAFAVVTRHGNSMRKGWGKILEIIRNLFINSLLPGSMLQVEDFLSGTTSIPLKPKTPPPSKQQNRRDGSLLSTLSSYLLSPYSNDEGYRADPTEDEIESTMCAVDCVTACKLEELFSDMSSLDLDPLKSLLTSMQEVGYDFKAIEETKGSIPYNPVTVLFLEFMVTVAVRNQERIEIVWPYAVDYIFGVLKHADKQSVLVVERTVVALLRLCICFSGKEHMQEDILKCLKVLRDFPPAVTLAVAEQMMAGIYSLSNANSENLNNLEFVDTILEIKQKVASAM